MLFTSFTFLSCFLPAVLGIYFLIPSRHSQFRNNWLLFASLLFYGWGEPFYILYLLGVILLTHMGGLASFKFRSSKIGNMASWFVCAILVLGLVYFKYVGFLFRNLGIVLGIRFPTHAVKMPLGISFFTFQAMSYVLDVRRRVAVPSRNILTTALYIVLFPQLVAGPIVKYRDIARQIAWRNTSLEQVANGLRRFVEGLAKKVLLANQLAVVADSSFDIPPSELSLCAAWIGSLFYAFQIYFDFGGYSDMAIGLCEVFGFKIAENFRYPYLSRSVTEFWRRWHISLSSWFKDYLYIPMGGSRCSKSRNVRNLFVVFLATGIWHGAEWTFVAWGCYYGFLVVAERLCGLGTPPTAGSVKDVLRHTYFVISTLCGWTLFRANDIDQAIHRLGTMFFIVRSSEHMPISLLVPPSGILVLGIALLTACGAFRCFLHRSTRLGKNVSDAVRIALLIAAEGSLAASSFNPFIYFRF